MQQLFLDTGIDMGVDGVFQTRAEKFNAYQVKFRTGRPALTWTELSTFMSRPRRLATRPLKSIADSVRIRMLCTTCRKFENDIAIAPCDFCGSIAFPEHVLCELTRGAQEKLKKFRCDAFRPKLSLVGGGRRKLSETVPENVMGAVQKYRLAVALQQLQRNRMRYGMR